MRAVVVFAALALIAGVVVPRYASRTAAPPAAATPQPATASAAEAVDSRSVIVPRDAHGQFQVEARVDGRRLSFMVDTGASVVALTAADAASLGLHPTQREFVAEVRTANGTVRAAPATLDTVEVGGLVVHNVAALVLPDAALSDNLLGLSFLSRLRRFEYSGGKLVLEQ